MIIHSQVPLHRLILSLSDALDCVHPGVADHQHRVAYVSLHIARRTGLSKSELFQIFHAAALHDIGLVRVEDRVAALHFGQLEDVAWHAEAGFELLNDNPLFSNIAEVVRHHHQPWAHGQGAIEGHRSVPFASHILVLADEVVRAIQRDVPILGQAKTITERITSLGEERFHPGCVEAFLEAARPEAFWLDCVSDRIYSVLLEQMDWPSLTVDEQAIEPIAKIFGRVVDAASPWTATHTAGVAASAVQLAERLHFSPREIVQMRVAGYLHDLGKLTVPARILDKPAKLDADDWAIVKGHTYHTFRILNTIGGMPEISEWAAFHHERLDGGGYPFHHRAADLTLGARIMAVADVFTALTEDRPYRKGMSREQTLGILDDHVRNGGLDGAVVAALRDDYDTILVAREREQQAYREKQERLAHLLAGLQPAAG